MNNAILTAVNLSKSYHEGPNVVNVLQAINFTVHAGEKIAIIGPSGSGKSTLLHIMGGLDNPSFGQLLIEKHNWQQLTEKKRCQLRNTKLGFIYQFHHLLPEFTALENVTLPLLLAGDNILSATKKATVMLNQVNLDHRLQHKPAELSGGERQRVAIARALIHQPLCILADEPTGNLDQATASKVFELMLDLNQQSDSALVIVTHDISLANKMDQVWALENGRLKQKLPNNT